MRKLKRSLARAMMCAAGIGNMNKCKYWDSENEKWRSYFAINWRKTLKGVV